MEISKLDLKISDEENEGPMFLAILNERVVGVFVILSLELSAKKDYVYPILNCTCGEWGCGGLYVIVKNLPDYVVWEKVFHTVDEFTRKEDEDREIETPVYFHRSDYVDLINTLLKEKEKYPFEKERYEEDLEWYKKGGVQEMPYCPPFGSINFSAFDQSLPPEDSSV